MSVTTALPATPAQRNFINSLRIQRALAPLTRDEDAALDMRAASREIDRLKTLPVVAPVAPAARAGLFDGLPTSKYAVELDGTLVFCEIRTWQGRTYMRRLLGAPGDWNRVKPTYAEQRSLVAAIHAATAVEAAKRYSFEFTRCCVCEAPLSDEESRRVGMGPVCRNRF